MTRAAGGVATWRQASAAPPDARLFPTHPDVGPYLAWFAPGERSFLDTRLRLFADVAGEFAELSRAVGVLPGEGGSELVRRHNVAAVLLYDPDGARMTRALGAAAAGRWEVVRIDGSAVLLAPPGLYAGRRFDADRAAFTGDSELPVAGSRPPALAEQVPWWQLRGGRGRTGSWEADAATVYLRLAEAGPSQSPALPLLAVRAGRAGAEVDPADPVTWVALGRAYTMLGGSVWEREAGGTLTLLRHVRPLQATGALVQAARLNPDSAPIHESLARLFLRRSAIDLAHRHALAASRLLRRGGPQVGESPEVHAVRANQLGELAGSLETAVMDAENRLLVRTAGLTGDPLARARTAAELGLTQKAIDILVASHPDLYGATGIGLLADLLLQTGQMAECRVLLDRDELRRNPGALGLYHLPRPANADGTAWPYRLPAYDWLDFCQRAAAGAYADGLDVLRRMCDRLDAEEHAIGPPVARGTAALVVGEVGLAVPPNPPLAWVAGLPNRVAVAGLLAQTKSLAVTRGDLMTLAGVLELERGNTQGAAGWFEGALALYKAAPASVLSRPGAPLAARYYEALRAPR
jgi:hypothetical protein